MGDTLFEVKTTVYREGLPRDNYTFVIAESMIDAVNKVDDELSQRDDNSHLFDKELQRSIARGDICESRVSRKYEDYVREREYIE